LTSNNKQKNKLYSIIGYGTFITRGYWKDKQNVEICLVQNYARVLPDGSWFPYVLKSEESSFWALKFDVNKQQLKGLDDYEGVPSNLFERIEIDVILKNKDLISAFLYIPTKQTIISQKLSLKQDNYDNWKEEIKKHPEIVDNFPELVK